MTTDAPAQRTPVRDPRSLALRNFAISMPGFTVLRYTPFGFERRKAAPPRVDQPAAPAAGQPAAVPA